MRGLAVILFARSGVMRSAFNAVGWDAIEVDTAPAQRLGMHWQGDALEFMDSRMWRAADLAVGTLSTVLGWAAQRGLVATNIAAEIGTLHRVDRSDLIWEERHWEAVKDVPAHIMRGLELGKLTGLRLGDLINLQWSQVGDNAIVLTTSKRKVRAAVPLYRELCAFLNEIGRGEGAVLRNSKGAAWTVSGFKSSWANAKPEKFDRHLHDLRGTCATWLATRQLTDTEIASVLGWKATRVAEIRARYVDQERTVIAMAERLSR